MLARFLIGSRRVVDPHEDEPDPFGDEVGDQSRWDRLVAQVGQRNSRIKAAGGDPLVDTPPVMLDRFEVLRTAGQGAMGFVFEAFDTGLGRRVALKVCMATRTNAAADLEHEARCLAKLSHPNIVAVYEVLRVESDLVLVMEYIDGQTFLQWQAATQPSWRVILDRCIAVGRALGAVHTKGLEHGDFKPSNAMIDHEGRVRVVDFGIARYSFEASAVNEAGETLVNGTPPYMPPERLLGKEQLPRKPGYPLADIYAFCVSVWELLFGVLPYAGETVPAMLESVLAGKFQTGRAGASVPDAVRDVPKRGLSARASERPQSMEELLRELSDAADGASTHRARWGKRVGVGLVAGLVVASGGMGAMWMRAPERDEVEPAAPVSEPAPVAVTPPQPDPVALTLTLAVEAVEAVRAGHPDLAIQHLELARSRARVDNDAIALRQVADQAEALGDEFDLGGDMLRAEECWFIAGDIFADLPGRTASLERLNFKRTRNR